MKTPKLQNKQNELFAIAESQQGYFTAKQAESVGFLPTNFQHHVKSGAWIREERGLYRLKNFPYSQVEAQYTHYSLWSRDRQEKVQGTYSHETALTMHGLSDVMPTKLSMSVPDHFRKSAKTPKILKLYYQAVDPGDREERAGYQVTKPLKTLLDLVTMKETSEEFIEQALLEALDRGLILMKEIQSPKLPKDVREKFETWIGFARKSRKIAAGGR